VGKAAADSTNKSSDLLRLRYFHPSAGLLDLLRRIGAYSEKASGILVSLGAAYAALTATMAQ